MFDNGPYDPGVYCRMFSLLLLGFGISCVVIISSNISIKTKWSYWLVLQMHLALVGHQLGLLVLAPLARFY